MKYTKIGKRWFGLLFNTYRLDETITVDTRFMGYAIGKQFQYALAPNGVLTVFTGIVWDGPSGPTYDSPATMRASLVHDMFYDMIREGEIPWAGRKLADQELRRIALEDGMWRIRAWYWYWSLRFFGGYAARA